MDDFMMYKYLKSKGIGEHNYREKFRDFMDNYKRNRDFYLDVNKPYKRHQEDMWEDENPYKYHEDFDEDFFKMMRYMKDTDDYMDEYKARELVSKMYHTESGRKYVGEKYDMNKAKEVHERYKGALKGASLEEVYLAINSQYHDYAELFKSWFGSNIDQKVIDSAIVFWFKDTDSKKDSKVLDYFKD